MRKVYCDYCGRETEYVDSKVIYGKSYGKIYLCRNCMAYVSIAHGAAAPSTSARKTASVRPAAPRGRSRPSGTGAA